MTGARHRAGGVFRRSVQEISADRVLRTYGSVLASVHILTFLHWGGEPGLAEVIAADALPICWPFFEECHRFRFLTPAAVRAVLWAYLATAVGTLFAWRRAVAAGYWLLLALEVAKVLIIVQDYRLRLNQHYMAFFVVLVFLVLPGKRRLLQYLVVAFYFWAGTLKLNRDWLSGASLYRREALWVPEPLVPAACAYVVALEMGMVFGLLSRRRWVFWSALGQLVVFHVMSWPIVGFFYPSLMLALLSICPLSRLVDPETSGSAMLRSFRGREERWPAYALLGGFSLLQLAPYAFPGDSAVTGQGRLFALHMFDARVVCEASLTLHDGQGRTQRVRIRTDRGSIRTRCDPIVHFNVARAFCREGAASGRWTDLDLSLRSQRSTEATLRPVVEIERFCAANPTYDLWRPNPWIRTK
jgi:hypothetical protein